MLPEIVALIMYVVSQAMSLGPHDYTLEWKCECGHFLLEVPVLEAAECVHLALLLQPAQV